MSNPLTKLEEYLDEVVRTFVSEGYSTKYESLILYLLKELELQASRSSSFSKSDFEHSLGAVKEKIASRLELGLWR